MRDELNGFLRAGLKEEFFEDYTEPEPPWVRRFRAALPAGLNARQG